MLLPHLCRVAFFETFHLCLAQLVLLQLFQQRSGWWRLFPVVLVHTHPQQASTQQEVVHPVCLQLAQVQIAAKYLHGVLHVLVNFAFQVRCCLSGGPLLLLLLLLFVWLLLPCASTVVLARGLQHKHKCIHAWGPSATRTDTAVSHVRTHWQSSFVGVGPPWLAAVHGQSSVGDSFFVLVAVLHLHQEWLGCLRGLCPVHTDAWTHNCAQGFAHTIGPCRCGDSCCICNGPLSFLFLPGFLLASNTLHSTYKSTKPMSYLQGHTAVLTAHKSMHPPMGKCMYMATLHCFVITLAVTAHHYTVIILGQLAVGAKDLDAVQCLQLFIEAFDCGPFGQLAVQGIHVLRCLQQQCEHGHDTYRVLLGAAAHPILCHIHFDVGGGIDDVYSPCAIPIWLFSGLKRLAIFGVARVNAAQRGTAINLQNSKGTVHA